MEAPRQQVVDELLLREAMKTTAEVSANSEEFYK